MSKAKNAQAAAKKAAWAAKQQKEGNKVVNWIIGLLIAGGLVYLVSSFFMF